LITRMDAGREVKGVYFDDLCAAQTTTDATPASRYDHCPVPKPSMQQVIMRWFRHVSSSAIPEALAAYGYGVFGHQCRCPAAGLIAKPGLGATQEFPPAELRVPRFCLAPRVLHAAYVFLESSRSICQVQFGDTALPTCSQASLGFVLALERISHGFKSLITI
jgi:hypothetical protein